jgi:hypothetical protein
MSGRNESTIGCVIVPTSLDLRFTLRVGLHSGMGNSKSAERRRLTQKQLVGGILTYITAPPEGLSSSFTLDPSVYRKTLESHGLVVFFCAERGDVSPCALDSINAEYLE